MAGATLTRVRDIIPGVRGPGSDLPLADVYPSRREFADLYAKILMACAAHQARFLLELWADLIGTDTPAREYWANAVRQGRFIDFLNRHNPATIARVEARQ